MTVIQETLKICDRHADRLQWAVSPLQGHTPFDAQSLAQLTDVEIAVLDQFSTRFGKLQDTRAPSFSPPFWNKQKNRVISERL